MRWACAAAVLGLVSAATSAEPSAYAPPPLPQSFAPAPAPAAAPPMPTPAANQLAAVEYVEDGEPVLLAASAFAAERWVIYSAGSYTAHFRDKDGHLAAGIVGIAKYLHDDFAIALETAGYATRIMENDGAGHDSAVSVDVLPRWHFVSHDRFSLYLDGGVGLFYGGESLPKGGTHANFTLQAGVGGTLRLTERLHLMGGTRWFHLSNGTFWGDENPAFDGLTGYAGLLFAF